MNGQGDNGAPPHIPNTHTYTPRCDKYTRTTCCHSDYVHTHSTRRPYVVVTRPFKTTEPVRGEDSDFYITAVRIARLNGLLSFYRIFYKKKTIETIDLNRPSLSIYLNYITKLFLFRVRALLFALRVFPLFDVDKTTEKIPKIVIFRT